MGSSLCCKLKTASIIVGIIQIIEALILVGLAALALKEIFYLQSDEADEEHRANYIKTLRDLKLISRRTATDFNLMAILIAFVSIDFAICIVRIVFATILFIGIRKGLKQYLTTWMVFKLIDIIFTVILSPIIFFHVHLPMRVKPSYNYVTISCLVVATLLGAWFIKIVYDFRRECIMERTEEREAPPSKKFSFKDSL